MKVLWKKPCQTITICGIFRLLSGWLIHSSLHKPLKAVSVQNFYSRTYQKLDAAYVPLHLYELTKEHSSVD